MCIDFVSYAVFFFLDMEAKNGVVFFARYSNQFYGCKSFIFFMYLWTKDLRILLGDYVCWEWKWGVCEYYRYVHAVTEAP